MSLQIGLETCLAASTDNILDDDDDDDESESLFSVSQVQAEIKRKWRRWHLQRYMSSSDTKYQHPSMGSNGTNFSTQISMLTRSSPKTQHASSYCQDESSII